MKETLDIIEFEPDVIINFPKLERSGITKEMLREFCEEVVKFVQNDASFSVQSLKQNGFRASLFELGFSDWFYSNLLIADDRLGYGRIFGNLIFSKSEERITRRSLIVERIYAAGSIDRLDLIDELTNDFGCNLHETDQANLTFIIKDSEVVYDPYLDRYYQNEELYHRELDEEDF